MFRSFRRFLLSNSSPKNVAMYQRLQRAPVLRILVAFGLLLLVYFIVAISQTFHFRRALWRARRFSNLWNTGEPLVSVVLTTFNVQSYINTTMKALLTQSYSNLHIIAVDDGSSDKTWQYITEFERTDYRIDAVRISTTTLGGIATPANIGIDRAIGKYVAFVNGDDIPNEHFISKLVAVGESSKADMIVAKFSYYNESSKETFLEHDMQYWPKPFAANRSQSVPVSLYAQPGMLHLSPAPWRKLYTRKLLIDHNLRFPEGDFVFEDTAFHWAVHIHARKVAFVSQSLINFRIGRNAHIKHLFQQSNTSPPRTWWMMLMNSKLQLEDSRNSMSAIQVMRVIPHLNNAGKSVMKCSQEYGYCAIMRREFLNWLNATTWVIDVLQNCSDVKLRKKASSVYYRTIARWKNMLGADSSDVSAKITKPERILSIIIPTYNIRDFLPSLQENLERMTVSVEVIFVDDSSIDGTTKRLFDMVQTRNNWYLLHTKGGRPGLARNIGQLLAEGKYIFFLDADDEFNATLLETTARYTTADDLDVLMLPYKMINVKWLENKTLSVQELLGMPEKYSWRKAAFQDMMQKKIVAATSVNFPWNKIVRTDLLIRENVFHGPTVLNEDVQHHWHAIMAARSLDFFNGGVIVQHRRFVGSRETMTDVKDSRRLSLLHAVAMSNRVLVRNGFLEDLEIWKNWVKFTNVLVQWGKDLIPEENSKEYNQKSRELMRILRTKASKELL